MIMSHRDRVVQILNAANIRAEAPPSGHPHTIKVMGVDIDLNQMEEGNPLQMAARADRWARVTIRVQQMHTKVFEER